MFDILENCMARDTVVELRQEFELCSLFVGTRFTRSEIGNGLLALSK